jgi:uncharacterized membrane protein YeaQ/YmgE (transglycosylase-associated protein family)
MNMVLWLAAGALLALAASLQSLTLRRQRLLIDVTFGAVGALLGGAAAVPAAGWLSFDTDWRGLGAAVAGAAAMLFIARLRAHRG